MDRGRTEIRLPLWTFYFFGHAFKLALPDICQIFPFRSCGRFLIKKYRQIICCSNFPGDSNDSLHHYWNGWWVKRALSAGQSPYWTPYLHYPDGLSLVSHDFAWFNIGTNHVRLREYVDAAHAYDYAFYLYSQLRDDLRPYRMMWYHTGPYWAYYYSGRYDDVEQLANTTLFATIVDPIIEESFYWRGMAREAQGDLEGAIFDWRICLDLYPGWDPAIYQLQRVGAWP